MLRARRIPQEEIGLHPRSGGGRRGVTIERHWLTLTKLRNAPINYLLIGAVPLSIPIKDNQKALILSKFVKVAGTGSKVQSEMFGQLPGSEVRSNFLRFGVIEFLCSGATFECLSILEYGLCLSILEYGLERIGCEYPASLVPLVPLGICVNYIAYKIANEIQRMLIEQEQLVSASEAQAD
eukprot:Gb_15848 [translate_table: standard]